MDGTTARLVLGVPENGTKDDVDRAFRRAVVRAHPDRGGDAARFRDLVAARALLLAACPAARKPITAGGDRFRAAWDARPPTTLDLTDTQRAVPGGWDRVPAAAPSFSSLLDRALADAA